MQSLAWAWPTAPGQQMGDSQKGSSLQIQVPSSKLQTWEGNKQGHMGSCLAHE